MSVMTEIRILQANDQAALEDFLRPRMDSSIFLLNNSRRAGLVDRGQYLEGTYFAAFEDGRIVGMAAHYWLRNVIVQCPVEHLDAVLAEALAAAVRPIEGLLGPGEQVLRAKEILGLTDEQIQLDDREGLYSLPLDELIVPEALRSGRVRGRRIERRDLDLVAAWRVAYHLEALKAEETPELRDKARDEIAGSLERGETWVLEDGGELVASTSFGAALDEVVQVGGVWTPPELRGRGYGRAVVAVSLLDARAAAVDRAVLFTGDDNIPAVKAYLALGFRRIGDYRVVLLRSSSD